MNPDENSTIQIRNTVTEDAEHIAEIEKTMWLDIYPNQEANITENDIMERFAETLDRVEIIQEMINSEEHHLLVATTDNKIVGYFHGYKGLNENQIIAMYVLPGFQGRNTGKTAFEKMLEWFGQNKSVFVEIAEYNKRSINFFKSLGFAEAEGARRKETWNILPSGKAIPIVFMRKAFGEQNNG